jgi:histidyl-tRNA synthetase
MIFEVFDLNKENTRSMFGGGRYNGLSTIFKKDQFDAVGAAPGDETIRLFLESWNLIDKVLESTNTQKYFVPLLSESLVTQTLQIADKLRTEGKSVIAGLDLTTVSKALSEANKKEYDFVVIFGEQENTGGFYTLKNMKAGEQQKLQL